MKQTFSERHDDLRTAAYMYIILAITEAADKTIDLGVETISEVDGEYWYDTANDTNILAEETTDNLCAIADKVAELAKSPINQYL
jgi:PHP family Zn ribbon phosphoesterase